MLKQAAETRLLGIARRSGRSIIHAWNFFETGQNESGAGDVIQLDDSA